MNSNEKISKSSCQTNALGAIDELNSFLGIVISFSESSDVRTMLLGVQKNLLVIGSIIGGSDLLFSKSETTKLEKQIDQWEKLLPKLSNFIKPGGSKSSSLLHFSRALTRRVEREVVELGKEKKIPSSILSYLNRLSDYLFTLARVENFMRGFDDIVWKNS